MVQGSMTCIKYLMFVFNFIFVICGLVLIIVGAVVSAKDVTYFLDIKYVTVPVIMIVVGCAIFLVAFFGCCGAVKENHCMVLTFGLLVFVIFVVEIAGGITAYVYKGDVQDFLKHNMNSTLAQQKPDGITAWDEMQIRMKCCGVDGPHDYIALNLDVPKSCCKHNETCSESAAWQEGCFPKMVDKVKKYIAIVGGVAVGIGVIELLGCMFAWCLASAIKRDYEGV